MRGDSLKIKKLWFPFCVLNILSSSWLWKLSWSSQGTFIFPSICLSHLSSPDACMHAHVLLLCHTHTHLFVCKGPVQRMCVWMDGWVSVSLSDLACQVRPCSAQWERTEVTQADTVVLFLPLEKGRVWTKESTRDTWSRRCVWRTGGPPSSTLTQRIPLAFELLCPR